MKGGGAKGANRLCQPCQGCAYLGSLYANGQQSWRCCDYILITGHSRPCPGGSECTAEKLVRKRR